MESVEFLQSLFGDWQNGYLVMWRGDTKRSEFLARDDLAKAGVLVEQCRGIDGADIYFGCGLQGKPTKGRGQEAGVVAIPGFWADLDFATKDEKYPPRADAMKAIAAMPLPASVIVETGGGLHVYWLFRELCLIGHNAKIRDYMKGLSVGWQALLGEKLRKAGGYVMDSTADLSRVLRPVGSWSHRHSRLVTLAEGTVDADHWPRYEVDDFAKLVRVTEGVTTAAVKHECGDFNIDKDAGPQIERFDTLCENCPEVKRIWEHRVNMPSNSEYEMSLASHAAMAAWSEQEIANLLIAHRRKWGPDRMSRILASNGSYLRHTIGKAIGDRDRHNALVTANVEPVEIDILVNGKPAKKPDVTPSDRDKTLGELSRIFGVQVDAWIQFGKQNPLYTLVLKDGTQIAIGDADAVTSGDKAFMGPLYAETAVRMKHVDKKAWPGVCRLLGEIRTLIDAGDAGEVESVRYGIEEYLAFTGYFAGERIDSACTDGEPFVRNGQLHVFCEPIRRWLNIHTGEKWRKKQVLEAMRMIGFSQITIAYNAPGGKRTSRFYWQIDVTTFAAALAQYEAGVNSE